MRREEVTPNRIELTGYGRDGEYEESHPAFAVAVVTRASGGARTVFQSDLQHSETIRLSISTAVRGRGLMHDWVHPKKELIEVEMSLAQWGSLVSSIGIGSGVPVTLRRTESEVFVAGIPYEPRIAVVMDEARGATTKLMDQIRRRYVAVKEAFEGKQGIKVQRAAIDSLGHALNNAESNTGFAVKSVADAAEHIAAQAKSDIEAHILAAAQLTGLTAPILMPELGSTDTTLALEEGDS